MDSMQPPQWAIDYEDIPKDPAERHEFLVDLFGQYILWARDWALNSSRQIISSPEKKLRLGKIRGRRYEGVSSLTPELQDDAMELAEATVDKFIQLLLTVISGQGFDDRIGPNHVFRYRLEMEICDSEHGKVLESEIINRGGKKFFADYWGKWLNRFGTKPNRTKMIDDLSD